MIAAVPWWAVALPAALLAMAWWWMAGREMIPVALRRRWRVLYGDGGEVRLLTWPFASLAARSARKRSGDVRVERLGRDGEWHGEHEFVLRDDGNCAVCDMDVMDGFHGLDKPMSGGLAR